MALTFLRAGAIIIDLYRYLLWREWDPDGRRVLFIMLNPSTADGMMDDPTIRRCIGFAQALGFGSLSVTNLFGYRSTSPQALLSVADPIGTENDAHIVQASAQSATIIAAWGCHGRYLDRDRVVAELLNAQGYTLFCFGHNQDGSPKHPLYVRKDTQLQPFIETSLLQEGSKAESFS